MVRREWRRASRLIGVADLDRRGRVLAAVGGMSVVATVVVFLLVPLFTLVPLVAFIGIAGYGWSAYQASTARILAFLATSSAVTILGLITVFLFLQSLPVFELMGPSILWGSGWSQADEVFHLGPMIWGTLMTTVIALSVCAPLGIAGALFISEIAPDWARELVKPGVEILAGIPSIVYGFIGFTVLNTWAKVELEIPTLGSMLIAGLVIGVMALPTVVSVAEDALASVPDAMKDGSLAMGATDWQTIKSITIPAAFSGISAAVLLGMGRAIGETMAATVILCKVTETYPTPLYDPFDCTNTLTALIAGSYGSAHGITLQALFAAGVILFVTVTALSLISQYIERRMRRRLRGAEA
ncbi:MAG: phosphate ABC transporter permease subunit PstC [Halobacteriaceae archaeon]